MPIRVALRLVVALACVAGVAVSLISRDSRVKAEEVFRVYFEDKDPRGALARIDGARRLNPNYEFDLAEANLDRAGAVAILTSAVRWEPENAELWLGLAQAQDRAGDRAAAERSWARAHELAPRFVPPDGP